MKAKIQAFIFSLLLASTCAADIPVKIHLVRVRGDNALTPNQLITVWAKADLLLRAAGVDPILARITFLPDDRPTLSTLATRQGRLYFWRARAIRRRWGAGYNVTHVVFPMMSDQGALWYSGLATKICGFGDNAFSISSAGAVNNLDTQLNKSAVGIAHEVLHILGAKHTYTNDLMNTDALALSQTVWPLPVLQTTKNEVLLCQRRKGKRAAGRAASFLRSRPTRLVNS